LITPRPAVSHLDLRVRSCSGTILGDFLTQDQTLGDPAPVRCHECVIAFTGLGARCLRGRFRECRYRGKPYALPFVS
jgi:hypothetical protein